MRHADTVEAIVANGYCVGCGLCQSVAAPGQIEMITVPPGRLRPRVIKRLDPQTEASIAAVCPGVRVDGRAHSLEVDYPGRVDAVVGPTIRCFNAYATDHEIRFKAAAGGGLTALSQFLVETGEVDYVHHVAAHPERPLHSRAHESRHRSELLVGAGSRYGPVAPLVDIGARLARGERFAFIGKPCDVNAMRNLAKVDPRVDRLVPYMLTISCGGLIDYACFHAFLERHGLAEHELDVFRYRGHGWPGPHYARTHDGREAEESYLSIVYEHPVTTQFRCKLCPDHTGEQADVSVMDPWPGGVPEREEPPGRCLIQTRTRRGDDLVERAARAGYLYVEPTRCEDVRATQPHQVRKKSGMAARLLALCLAGAPLPRFRRIRLLRAMLAMPPLFHWRNFIGARRRIRRGDNCETLPGETRGE